MADTIVTSNYRITIPKRIRDAVGIHKGQTVEITASGNHITIQPLSNDQPEDREQRQSES